MNALFSRVEAASAKYQMFKPGERVLVACSGGADSVALFYLLKKLSSGADSPSGPTAREGRRPGRPYIKIHLALVHYDHALRPASSRDFQFVRALARKTKTPFYGGVRDPKKGILRKGLSPEEAARNLRYDFFKSVCRKTGISKIALGHHRDDQAETVLMRILQGTGLRGLQGIRPVVKLKGMTLVRPLVEISRQEIRNALRREYIRFREDRSNRSRKFLRNRIRQRLLPLLEKEFNPKIRESLCRLAETTMRESAGLDDWTRRHGKNFLRSRRNGTLTLARAPFLSLPNALQFRVLDQLVRLLHPASGLSFDAWSRIEQGFGRGRFRATLPQRLDLVLTPKKLTISRTFAGRGRK